MQSARMAQGDRNELMVLLRPEINRRRDEVVLPVRCRHESRGSARRPWSILLCAQWCTRAPIPEEGR